MLHGHSSVCSTGPSLQPQFNGVIGLVPPKGSKSEIFDVFLQNGCEMGVNTQYTPQVNSGHFDGTCWEHEVKKTSGTWGAQHLPKLRIGLVIKMCYVGAFPQGAAGSHPNGCELQTLGRIGGTWDSDRTGFMLNYTYGPTNNYKWSYNSYY